MSDDSDSLSFEESIDNAMLMSEKSDPKVVINFSEFDGNGILSDKKSVNTFMMKHRNFYGDIVECFYENRSFIFMCTGKDRVEKEIVIRFAKKFRRILKRYSLINKKISEKVIFNKIFEKVLDNPKIMKQFLSIESPIDQIEFIQNFLKHKSESIEPKYDESNPDKKINFCYLNSGELSDSEEKAQSTNEIKKD